MSWIARLIADVRAIGETPHRLDGHDVVIPRLPHLDGATVSLIPGGPQIPTEECSLAHRFVKHREVDDPRGRLESPTYGEEGFGGLGPGSHLGQLPGRPHGAEAGFVAGPDP